MSIYSNLKELYKDTNDIVNGKNIAWKIIYMLQNISFIIICMICLVDKCKIRTIILENIEFGISQSVCDFLNKYIVICVIFYFGYLVILTPIIKILYVKLNTEYNKNIIPIWYTIDEIIKILLNIMILIELIQDVILGLNGESQKYYVTRGTKKVTVVESSKKVYSESPRTVTMQLGDKNVKCPDGMYVWKESNN